MTSQLALLIALGLAVIILAVLLLTRIFAEKRHQIVLQGMSLTEFSDFLRSNSTEGKILAVAGKVSEVLKSACACERIIFLRKQRGMLELNYYYGITRFNRSDFRIKYTPELATQLRASFVPRPIESLRPHVPQDVFERITAFRFDLYFPIFWRDNLYGVYFIESNRQTRSEAFGMMVAGLAHSLSAAYHVRWHENRYEKLQHRQNAGDAAKTASTRQPSGASTQILRLVRHRNTETIVPRIVELVQKEIGAQRLLYAYQPKDASSHMQLVKTNITGAAEPPSRDVFAAVMQDLKRTGIRSVDSLTPPDAPAGFWTRTLKETGLQYLAPFSLSDDREGILALEGKNLPMDLVNRLQQLQGSARELFSNAQSFEQLEELSFTDNLTGLANQRYFRKRLTEEVNRARRYNRSIALIMFDLDELKAINDKHGHLAGDAVLSQLGPMLRTSIRAIDISARYGGDEFCIIMPEADAPTCGQFMQRIQSTIADSSFQIPDLQQEIACTISLGGAVFPLHADDTDKLIFAADMALLKAKAQGRNQYVLYSPETMVGTPAEH